MLCCAVELLLQPVSANELQQLSTAVHVLRSQRDAVRLRPNMHRPMQQTLMIAVVCTR